jgi:hypothetical protein
MPIWRLPPRINQLSKGTLALTQGGVSVDTSAFAISGAGDLVFSSFSVQLGNLYPLSGTSTLTFTSVEIAINNVYSLSGSSSLIVLSFEIQLDNQYPISGLGSLSFSSVEIVLDNTYPLDGVGNLLFDSSEEVPILSSIFPLGGIGNLSFTSEEIIVVTTTGRYLSNSPVTIRRERLPQKIQESYSEFSLISKLSLSFSSSEIQIIVESKFSAQTRTILLFNSVELVHSKYFLNAFTNLSYRSQQGHIRFDSDLEVEDEDEIILKIFA